MEEVPDFTVRSGIGRESPERRNPQNDRRRPLYERGYPRNEDANPQNDRGYPQNNRGYYPQFDRGFFQYPQYNRGYAQYERENPQFERAYPQNEREYPDGIRFFYLRPVAVNWGLWYMERQQRGLWDPIDPEEDDEDNMGPWMGERDFLDPNPGYGYIEVVYIVRVRYEYHDFRSRCNHCGAKVKSRNFLRGPG